MTLAYDMYMVAEEAAKEAAKKAAKKAFENGISQGAHQKAVETAKKLISLGLSQTQIASVTGLSPEEIEKL